jgi:hydrogenase-4 component F
VGIALALLGNFFLAVAARGDGHASLLLGDLLRGAGGIDGQWLRAAFVFLLVGYGTKMGLAPLHTWLPDAHGESPSVVSALLSGALLPCAFLGIMRALQVCEAAGQGEFARGLLVFLGLLSLFVAGVFILGQADFKRLLAYSSVEHMGILALGVGIGGPAAYGALLHVVNHGLTKGMLFMAAGNILAAYRTKSTREVRGVLEVLPASGVLWTAGFLAITGMPPFGTFLSEFLILRGAVDAGRTLVAVACLALLALVFVGMVSVLIRMTMGEPPGGMAARREGLLAVGPPAALGALALLLGVWVPAALRDVAAAAAAALGGVP